MNKNKKAEMGMGTLILFIAMILVAAVAAGVLISTTGSLQNKALATGKATTAQVGTAMEAVEVFAEDASSSNNLEDFYETIRLTSGSEDIRFNDLLLTVSLSDQSANYAYNSSIDCDTVSNVTYGVGFGVKYPISATTGHQDGYLVKGDVAQICFEAPRSVNESEDIKLTLIPRVGSPLVVDTTLPDLMVDKRITVFP